MGNQFEKFQIPHTGVDSTTLGRPTQSRSLHEKVSNWNSTYVDSRMSSDYTRTVLGFKSKDELADWSAIVPEWQYAERDENPYLIGSTIKRFRDDQFFRMDMEHPVFTTGLDSLGDYSAGTPASIDKPSFDVMDRNLVDPDGLTAYKNWPTEGWHSYGGKYDFVRPGSPYQGW